MKNAKDFVIFQLSQLINQITLIEFTDSFESVPISSVSCVGLDYNASLTGYLPSLLRYRCCCCCLSCHKGILIAPTKAKRCRPKTNYEPN